MRARELLETLEVVAGEPRIRAAAAVDKKALVLRVSPSKQINESAVKIEMADAIRTKLTETQQTDQELVDAFNAQGRAITALEDLPAVLLIRTKRLLAG